MKTREKLAALRALMAEHGLAAYLVPSADPHLSEYVPPAWKRRAWMSGFTGSAGELLVLPGQAALWTDGRYFLQAEAELRGSGIKLMKMGDPGVPTLHEFLGRTLREDDALGCDPQVLSVAEARRLESTLKPARAVLRLPELNLVDAVWEDRTEFGTAPLVPLPPAFSGETTTSKLLRLRKALDEKRAEAHILTAHDAIAWLCNLRGADVAFMPVFIAYAVVTRKEASLFVRPEIVTPAVRRALGKQVDVRPYEEFGPAVRELAARKPRVWLDEANASRWVLGLLDGCPLVTEPSPVLPMKSRKNATEIAGMKEAHRRDGVAMVRFLHWLEDAVPRGGVTEISAAEKLEAFRAEGEHFRGLSFDAISGYAGHGAIIHYRVTPETDVPIRPEGLYLIDSGGQYLDGTTDITRTVLLGKSATREQRDRYTRVLKGHIALAKARFPAGIPGYRLDTLARQPLWEAGLDYNHGTGHGVGAYLGVHEGPQNIGTRAPVQAAPLEPGNILSNEPGFYVDGAYGIRIENLVLVVEDSARAGDGRTWLRFETITLCPIDTRVVEPRLLTPAERTWLNDYHRGVLKALAPDLDTAERAWLKRACAPIG